MGVVLEVGKLVTASFLYRSWNTLTTLFKSYLISAVVVLMIITSLGIYGLLSQGYLQDSVQLKQADHRIELISKEKQTLQDRKTEIDKQIAQLPSDYSRARVRLIDAFNSETDQINARLIQINQELLELNKQKIVQEAHVGPIVFIAKAIGADTDSATSYIILLIIFAFDPLAVVLTIGVNMSVRQYRLDKNMQHVNEKATRAGAVPEDTTKDIVMANDEITVDGPVVVYHQPSYSLDYINTPAESDVVIDNPIEQITTSYSLDYISTPAESDVVIDNPPDENTPLVDQPSSPHIELSEQETQQLLEEIEPIESEDEQKEVLRRFIERRKALQHVRKLATK
jgi:uncharacterized protein YukE